MTREQLEQRLKRAETHLRHLTHDLRSDPDFVGSMADEAITEFLRGEHVVCETCHNGFYSYEKDSHDCNQYGEH